MAAVCIASPSAALSARASRLPGLAVRSQHRTSRASSRSALSVVSPIVGGLLLRVLRGRAGRLGLAGEVVVGDHEDQRPTAHPDQPVPVGAVLVAFGGGGEFPALPSTEADL